MTEFSIFRFFFVELFLSISVFPSMTAAAEKSCANEIGIKKATKLVNECLQVSPATHPPCNVSNPCEMISAEIVRGSAFGRQPSIVNSATDPSTSDNEYTLDKMCTEALDRAGYKEIRSAILGNPSPVIKNCSTDDKLVMGNFYSAKEYATSSVSC
jgi:hypothetical protein